jgi:hypothetical protein
VRGAEVSAAFVASTVDLRGALRVGSVELVLDVQNLLGASWRDGEFVFPSSWSPPASPSRLPARHFTAGAPRQLVLTLEVHL